MRLLVVLGCLIPLVVSSEVYALAEPFFENGDWTAETGVEYRFFKDPGEFGQSQNVLALHLSGEYYTSWNDDSDLFTFVPYLLIDQEDSERTHADIREALWVHVDEFWELRTGITRVFWGKTEFVNLVDVVNQKDLVDDDDEKLGQPMLNLSVVRDRDIIDFYLLFGFRERTFPGVDGRLRTPLPVDASNPIYSPETSKNDIDFAFRWQRPLNDHLDMALSYFSGVNREPWYSYNYSLSQPMLIPNYHHIDQVGLELEYIYESWALKFEGINVRSEVEDYYAMVGGVEYTFNGVFNSDADLTLITEYVYDSRDGESPTYLEHDVAFGGRLFMNDEYGTTFQGGMLWDPDTNEKAVTFQAERRLGSQFKLEFRAVTVLERAAPELSDSTLAAVSALVNSPIIQNNYNYRQLLDFVIRVIQEEGLEELLTDPTIGLDTLQQLQRLITDSRKLNLIESDDFVELRLNYYY